MELLAVIIIIAAIWWVATSTDRNFHNYKPPTGYQLDYNKMMDDMIINHHSKDQIKRNTVNGKYNMKRK